MLQCKKCLQYKDESEFKQYVAKWKKWYRRTCFDCMREYDREYRNNNKDKVDAYRKKRKENNEVKNKESKHKYNMKESTKEKKRIRREKFKEENLFLYSFKTVFWDIKHRCNNPKAKYYHRYWWRWIKCLRNTFEDFYNDMYESYIGHVNEYGLWMKYTQIDRIDNDWNYCKENCRWVTAKENNHYNHAKEFNN